MSKRVKKLILQDLERRYSDVDHAILIECAGLTCEETGDFRGTVREAGATISVVKNTLARRVFEQRGLTFDDACFEGSTAIVWGNDDAVAASKAVAAWRKENKKKIPIKGAVLEGEAVVGDAAERLVDMPSVEEVKSMLVSAIAGPLTGLVNITNNVLSGVPGVLQAIKDDKEGA
ncbi:MAG: 50S ribosomal protein L10 [Planctomycetota bacterium]